MTEEFIVEKQLKKNWWERIWHTICLLFPLIMAFCGYFSCPSVIKLLNKLFKSSLTVTETSKFIFVIIFFLLASTIVFFKTRNTNPIIKIRVLSKKK